MTATYTPVPTVAAGDWIDEIFINTYWVDNMAAGLPDLFSAVGQLAVGAGVDDMGILNAGANNAVLMANSADALGLKWVTTPTLGRYTNGSYSGSVVAIGSYTVNISGWGITNPSPLIRAIIAKVSVKWATASDANYLSLMYVSPYNMFMTARSLVANYYMDSVGIVGVNPAGDFRIDVGGANTTSTIIDIVGWFQ